MQLVRTPAAISFRNILFLTDFSGATTRALAYALAFARHFNARLFPAHVIDRPVEPGTVAVAGEASDLEDQKRQQLSRQVEFNGIEFRPLITQCEFEAAIPHWVAEHNIDLIVMGTHGRSGVQRFLLGSTSEWVVRSGLCPVLTVGPYVDVPRLFKLNIEKILYPATLVDGATGLALDHALSLAAEKCARLMMLHVLPDDARDYQDRTRILRFALNALQGLLPPNASSLCRPEFAVDAGEAGERILVHARNERPDMIVMGLRQNSMDDEAHENGIAYRVISLAPCPVLTVPESVQEH